MGVGEVWGSWERKEKRRGEGGGMGANQRGGSGRGGSGRGGGREGRVSIAGVWEALGMLNDELGTGQIEEKRISECNGGGKNRKTARYDAFSKEIKRIDERSLRRLKSPERKFRTQGGGKLERESKDLQPRISDTGNLPQRGSGIRQCLLTTQKQAWKRKNIEGGSL